MSVSNDRWTCPTCGRTVIISGSAAAVRNCIRAEQERHRDGHRAGEKVLARLGLPEPTRRRRRRAA